MASVAQQITQQGGLSEHRELLEAELLGAGFCPFSGTASSDLAGNVTLFPACSVLQKCDGHQGIQLQPVLLGYWNHLQLCASSSKTLVLLIPLKQLICVVIPIKNVDLLAYR